jgi:hypothetical protein
MFEPKQKTFDVQGETITIKALSVSQRNSWIGQEYAAEHLVSLSLVEPTATPDEVSEWQADAVDVIVTEILDLNNLKKKG